MPIITLAEFFNGMGRVFIRNVVAYDISALMEYKDLSLRVPPRK
jgi:isoaspartyl peptidase/L-asparaginase-like protein (Ntn-hydrolase superfamily)